MTCILRNSIWEKANLLVTGYIKSLEYTGESLGKRGKGLLERLFR